MAISEETLTVIGRLRASTGYGVDQVTQDLSTAWARAWNEVADEWEAAIGDLIAARTNGAWPTATQVRRAERAAKALAATRDLLADLAGTVPLRVGDGLPELLEQVAELTRTVVATQFPVQAGGTASVAAGLDRVSKDEITAIVDRISTRVTALSLPITARTDAAIRSVLIRGVALGMHPDAAARLMVSRVRGSFDLGLARARNIARTEMLDAHRTAERAQQDRSKDVLTGWTWLATLDHRTCESCLAMHGSEHPLTKGGPHDHQQGRCDRLPVVKAWKDLGYAIPEPESLLPDARAWFDRQPESVQISIMGERKLALLRSGRIGWDDLAMRRRNPGWRPSYAPRPLRDLERLAASRDAA